LNNKSTGGLSVLNARGVDIIETADVISGEEEAVAVSPSGRSAVAAKTGGDGAGDADVFTHIVGPKRRSTMSWRCTWPTRKEIPS
jgi:hypothetical protein